MPPPFHVKQSTRHTVKGRIPDGMRPFTCSAELCP